MGRLIRAVRLLARITRQVSVTHLIFFVYIQSAAVNWVCLRYWLQSFDEVFWGCSNTGLIALWMRQLWKSRKSSGKDIPPICISQWHFIWIVGGFSVVPWISCNLGDFQLISSPSSCRFASVGKWLLQANILTRISAFFVTNPIVLWFCAGVCKGQLSLIRKEDDIYKWVLVSWYENNLAVLNLLAPSLIWCFLVYTYHQYVGALLVMVSDIKIHVVPFYSYVVRCLNSTAEYSHLRDRWFYSSILWSSMSE